MRGCEYLISMVLLLATSSTAIASGSMRCGRYVVNTNDSQSQVLDICGEPRRAWQDGFIEQTVRRGDGAYSVGPAPPLYPRQPGYETEVRRIIPVYKWEYNLGPGTLLKTLIFHGDTLVGIIDGPRQ